MAEVTVHNMPSVFVMETEMPLSMVSDINEYLDEYKETEDKKSLADSHQRNVNSINHHSSAQGMCQLQQVWPS